MKFCFVDRDSAHSIWSLIDQIARPLIENHHQVTYCILREIGSTHIRSYPKGVEVKYIDVPIKKNVLCLLISIIQFSSKFKKIINGIDVLHTNFAYPGVFAKYIARKNNIKIITTHHEIYSSMNLHWRIMVSLTQKLTDASVYISDQVCESFKPLHDLPRREIIIKNGVDIEYISSFWPSSATSNNEYRVVCPGRLVPEKGQQYLIEAWPAVLTKYPAAQLYIIGSGSNKAYLQERVKTLGIVASTNFMGWLPNKDTLEMMSTANACVIPSDGTQEGFGLVIAEVMALRSPLVCSDIPVFREIALDTATFFTKCNSTSLSNELINILGDDRNAQYKVNAAFTRVNEFFDKNYMVNNYINLYKNLLEGC